MREPLKATRLISGTLRIKAQIKRNPKSRAINTLNKLATIASI